MRPLFVFVIMGMVAFICWRIGFSPIAPPDNASMEGRSQATWRYRMTAVFETPEGLKTGSVVREVNFWRGIHIVPEVTSKITVRGEALVIDLGKHGMLFGLLRGAFQSVDYGSDVILGVFPEGKMSGKVILTQKYYPMFVIFKDINNPLTIESITNFGDDATGGHYSLNYSKLDSGVRLKEISIEITDDPITHNLMNVLPWLKKRRTQPGYIGGSPAKIRSDPSQTYLTTADFIRGHVE